ncbi:peptidoglycan-binding protein [Pacificoceanicola onchidii]|uniref:peptidoglycan-binding protein n=1 Tax=Pacificoceanicola onchidii TaxID=2562685 RepID=UPI0010A69019|nr:peptidoglycan-binding protein [Pacificoceanicola onchidii]
MGIGKLGAATVLIAAGLLGGVAQAAGDALIIGNARYGAGQSLFGADRVHAAAEPLRRAGISVTAVNDADEPAMNKAFTDFVRGIDPKDAPLVVVLLGRFLHSQSGTYLLPTGVGPRISSERVLTRAFPVDAVLAVLADHPGRAFLVLGETAEDVDAGRYLKTGIGDLDIPQGVTVMQGAATDVGSYVVNELARPNVWVSRAERRYGLTIDGFNPREHVVFLPDDIAAPGGIDGSQPDRQTREQADNAAWGRAQRADSADGYRRYLQAYPYGLHAAAARQRIKAISAEPFYAQRRAEEALGLNREERRKIQRNLTTLGHGTRGVDGIFGSGTRNAVKSWQRATGRVQSGYLDRPQIVALSRAARARAEEIKAEEERRAAALRSQDNQLWEQVTQRGDEESVRRYLKTYPKGLHAKKARALLAEFEAQRARQKALLDREAWDDARYADTVKAYRGYLDAYPKGAFAARAQARIKELRGVRDDEQALAKARAAEKALGLNPVTARLAEARLQQLGFDPGQVDGKFNKRTREALRAFQKTHGLNVTGYLNEQTVVRLLADAIIRR